VRPNAANVDRTSVVILSGHSLFTEGVAARLRKHADRLDLHVVDADCADALEQVVSARPSTVILDADRAQGSPHCSLNQLFLALPELRVVRLDPERDQIQLLTSEQRLAVDIGDLIEVIQPPHAMEEAE
jgi:DNA-binding NarL/FixJ family response regulator